MTKKMERVELTTLQAEGNVADLISELQELSKKYGSTLDYEVELKYCWGDPYVEFTIYHNREETDEEYQARLQSEAYRQKLQDERDQKELERLMLKFKKPTE
jgi:hypothetical protein